MLRPFQLTGYDGKSWPVLLLLLLVVLLPTLGVLWFMDQAMRNERLAVRQKLQEVYRSELREAQQALEAEWQERAAKLEVADREPARVFAEAVRSGLAESVIVFASGRPAYPSQMNFTASAPRPTGRWLRGQRLERAGDFMAAAELYQALAEEARAQSQDVDSIARALQAQARCLVRAQRSKEAIRVLIDQLAAPELARAADAQGRLIAPSALLRALQLMAPGDPDFRLSAQALRVRLGDYDRSPMPSPQRIFLMKELAELEPESRDAASLATLEAEELAALYLASNPPSASDSALQPSGLPGIWHLSSPSGSVIALFEHAKLRQRLEMPQELPKGSALEVLEPGEEIEDFFLVKGPAGDFFPGWSLVLRPVDQTHFAASADQQVRAYLLIGVLVVVAILLLALLIMRLIGRQLRLTRLKNDLLSTVSHELRTPLASMRLLVDTLLASESEDPQRTREYLELIAKENARLSRLVENFLTFSRVEQDRHRYEKHETGVAELAAAATASVAERFENDGYSLQTEIEPGLPSIVADHEALVTVLINLLDNALRYSDKDSDDEKKLVDLRGFRANGHLCLAVSDRGIGLSKVDAAKIFDRFYQVDQSLTRSEGGCGLGLSIVNAIVAAHGGSVDVESQLGEGSTFTIRLPLDQEEELSDAG